MPITLPGHKTCYKHQKTLTSSFRNLFFHEIFNLRGISILSFHKMQEAQATQLRHQIVSQSESTSVSPFFADFIKAIRLSEFVLFAIT